VNPGTIGASALVARPERPNWWMLVPFSSVPEDMLAVAQQCGAPSVTRLF